MECLLKNRTSGKKSIWVEKEGRISPSTHWRDFTPSLNSTRINVISEIWGPTSPRDGTQNQERPKLTALHHLNRHQQTHSEKKYQELPQLGEFPCNILGFPVLQRQKSTLDFLDL